MRLEMSIKDSTLYVLEIYQPMQRTIRNRLYLLDIEIIVLWHVLQSPRRLRLDELRARDVHQHALLAMYRPGLCQASVYGFCQPEIVRSRRVDDNVKCSRSILDLMEILMGGLGRQSV